MTQNRTSGINLKWDFFFAKSLYFRLTKNAKKPSVAISPTKKTT